MTRPATPANRVLFDPDDGRGEPFDPSEVLFLEPEGDGTEVLTRGRWLRDLSSLPKLVARFPWPARSAGDCSREACLSQG